MFFSYSFIDYLFSEAFRHYFFFSFLFYYYYFHWCYRKQTQLSKTYHTITIQSCITNGTLSPNFPDWELQSDRKLVPSSDKEATSVCRTHSKSTSTTNTNAL